jgi:hypothetical protein
VVENSFDPFHGKVVSDDSGFETLESMVFYFIQVVILEDRECDDPGENLALNQAGSRFISDPA